MLCIALNALISGCYRRFCGSYGTVVTAAGLCMQRIFLVGMRPLQTWLLGSAVANSPPFWFSACFGHMSACKKLLGKLPPS